MSVAARGPVRLWRMMRQIDSFYGAYGTHQYGQAPSPKDERRVFVKLEDTTLKKGGC
jgi:hypothetical protein